MKKFWTKLSLRVKIIFFVFLAVLVLSVIGYANYKAPDITNATKDNSNFVNKITNRNPILSYPVSYTSLWTGKITLVPTRVNDLEYSASNSQQCSGITEKMDVYYTPEFDSLMIINNKNLLTTPNEQSNFETATSIINGSTNFDNNNAELQSFRTYCSYFSLHLVDELSKKMPNTDYSRSIVGLGLRQGIVDDVSKVGLYIYVYAIKDDYIIQLSRSLQGNFLFTQSNWDTCKVKTLQTDQNECLRNIYIQDASMKSKIEAEADNLIQTFELP